LANSEHIHTLRQGAAIWNAWRRSSQLSPVDLGGADLDGMNLAGFNLSLADLGEASLVKTNLTGSVFTL
jgi:uncharacterized protein YjbI with pentapeptide repeats